MPKIQATVDPYEPGPSPSPPLTNDSVAVHAILTLRNDKVQELPTNDSLHSGELFALELQASRELRVSVVKRRPERGEEVLFSTTAAEDPAGLKRQLRVPDSGGWIGLGEVRMDDQLVLVLRKPPPIKDDRNRTDEIRIKLPVSP